MILTRPWINLFMKIGLITIEPFSSEQLNVNSYDVRLHSDFYNVNYINESNSYSFDYFNSSPDVEIPSGKTVLARTLERIGTHVCVVAQLRSKSTTRRCGITVCDDAGLGDVGYDNFWTVELTSHLGYGIPKLNIGQRFAQIVFYLTPPVMEGYSGQYNGDEWPECMKPKKYRNNNGASPLIYGVVLEKGQMK